MICVSLLFALHTLSTFPVFKSRAPTAEMLSFPVFTIFSSPLFSSSLPLSCLMLTWVKNEKNICSHCATELIRTCNFLTSAEEKRALLWREIKPKWTHFITPKQEQWWEMLQKISIQQYGRWSAQDIRCRNSSREESKKKMLCCRWRRRRCQHRYCQEESSQELQHLLRRSLS